MASTYERGGSAKSARIRCIAHFDSCANPNITVRWGDQTWDEMMIGFLTLSRLIERETTASAERDRRGKF